MKSYLNVIPTQGICCFATCYQPQAHYGSQFTDWDAALHAGLYSYRFTVPQLCCWLFLLFRSRHMYNKIQFTKDQKKLWCNVKYRDQSCTQTVISFLFFLFQSFRVASGQIAMLFEKAEHHKVQPLYLNTDK